jgi:hypothetical protein
MSELDKSVESSLEEKKTEAKAAYDKYLRMKRDLESIDFDEPGFELSNFANFSKTADIARGLLASIRKIIDDDYAQGRDVLSHLKDSYDDLKERHLREGGEEERFLDDVVQKIIAARQRLGVDSVSPDPDATPDSEPIPPPAGDEAEVNPMEYLQGIEQQLAQIKKVFIDGFIAGSAQAPPNFAGLVDQLDVAVAQQAVEFLAVKDSLEPGLASSVESLFNGFKLDAIREEFSIIDDKAETLVGTQPSKADVDRIIAFVQEITMRFFPKWGLSLKLKNEKNALLIKLRTLSAEGGAESEFKFQDRLDRLTAVYDFLEKTAFKDASFNPTDEYTDDPSFAGSNSYVVLSLVVAEARKEVDFFKTANPTLSRAEFTVYKELEEALEKENPFAVGLVSRHPSIAELIQQVADYKKPPTAGGLKNDGSVSLQPAIDRLTDLLNRIDGDNSIPPAYDSIKGGLLKEPLKYLDERKKIESDRNYNAWADTTGLKARHTELINLDLEVNPVVPHAKSLDQQIADLDTALTAARAIRDSDGNSYLDRYQDFLNDKFYKPAEDRLRELRTKKAAETKTPEVLAYEANPKVKALMDVIAEVMSADRMVGQYKDFEERQNLELALTAAHNAANADQLLIPENFTDKKPVELRVRALSREYTIAVQKIKELMFPPIVVMDIIELVDETLRSNLDPFRWQEKKALHSGLSDRNRDLINRVIQEVLTSISKNIDIRGQIKAQFRQSLIDSGARTAANVDAYLASFAGQFRLEEVIGAREQDRLYNLTRLQLAKIDAENVYEGNKACVERARLFANDGQMKKKIVTREGMLAATTYHEKWGGQVTEILQYVIKTAALREGERVVERKHVANHHQETHGGITKTEFTRKRLIPVGQALAVGEVELGRRDYLLLKNEAVDPLDAPIKYEYDKDLIYESLINESSGRDFMNNAILTKFRGQADRNGVPYSPEAISLAPLMFTSMVMLDVSFRERQKRTQTRGHNAESDDLDHGFFQDPIAAAVHAAQRYSKPQDWRFWMTVFYPVLGTEHDGRYGADGLPFRRQQITDKQESLLLNLQIYFETDSFAGKLDLPGFCEDPLYPDTFGLTQLHEGLPNVVVAGQVQYEGGEAILVGNKVFNAKREVIAVKVGDRYYRQNPATRLYHEVRDGVNFKLMQSPMDQYDNAEGGLEIIFKRCMEGINKTLTRDEIVSVKEGQSGGLLNDVLSAFGRFKMFSSRINQIITPFLTLYIYRLFNAYEGRSPQDRALLFVDIKTALKESSTSGGLNRYKYEVAKVIDNLVGDSSYLARGVFVDGAKQTVRMSPNLRPAFEYRDKHLYEYAEALFEEENGGRQAPRRVAEKVPHIGLAKVEIQQFRKDLRWVNARGLRLPAVREGTMMEMTDTNTEEK